MKGTVFQYFVRIEPSDRKVSGCLCIRYWKVGIALFGSSEPCLHNFPVQKFYQDECEERGGQALMPTRPAEGPRCACGEWAKADIENKKCVRKFSISSLVPMLICVFIEGIVNRNKRSWPILISRKFFSVPFITSPKPTSINEICTRNCMIVWATGFRQNIWSLMLTVGTAY